MADFGCWLLTGDTPAEHRLTFDLDDQAPHRAGRTDIWQTGALMTDRDHWPITEAVAGYRSQSEAEFGFRQLMDPHVVSFSPMHHWTEHNIRVHVFTCVLALQIGAPHAPTTPACTSRSANCSTPSPASRKPC